MSRKALTNQLRAASSRPPASRILVPGDTTTTRTDSPTGTVARHDAIAIPGGSQRDPIRDPLTKQRPEVLPDWLEDPESLNNLVEANWFCRHIGDLLSEDPVRNGITVTFPEMEKEDEAKALSQAVQQYLEELDAFDMIQEALYDEIVFGDGLLGIGVKQRGGTADPTQEAKPENVEEIIYLEPICRFDRFKRIVPDTDRESKTYGRPGGFAIKDAKGQDVILHASRALHFQTRKRKGKPFGLSFYAPIWTVIQVLENIEWSVGQVAFNMATRVITSDDLAEDMEERLGFVNETVNEMNSLSFLALKQGEALSSVPTNPGGIGEIANFVWDLASAATRINRSRLLGAQVGQLASAETDLTRYYEWIRARQESYLKAPIRKLVAMVLATKTVSKAGVPFHVAFNPIETKTEEQERAQAKDEAITRQTNVQAFQSLVAGLQVLVDMQMMDTGVLESTLKETLPTLGLENLMAKLFAEEGE